MVFDTSFWDATTDRALKTAMTAGLLWFAEQFRRNRKSGVKRDGLYESLKTEISSLETSVRELKQSVEQFGEMAKTAVRELAGVRREVDQDRNATNLVKESIHNLQMEFVRYLRNGGGNSERAP